MLAANPKLAQWEEQKRLQKRIDGLRGKVQVPLLLLLLSTATLSNHTVSQSAETRRVTEHWKLLYLPAYRDLCPSFCRSRA